VCGLQLSGFALATWAPKRPMYLEDNPVGTFYETLKIVTIKLTRSHESIGRLFLTDLHSGHTYFLQLVLKQSILRKLADVRLPSGLSM
jgi:hypothetical protein